MNGQADGAAPDTPELMSFAEAVEICGPELIAKLEAHAAAAPPFTDEQKRILATAFAQRGQVREPADFPRIPAPRRPSDQVSRRHARRPEGKPA